MGAALVILVVFGLPISLIVVIISAIHEKRKDAREKAEKTVREIRQRAEPFVQRALQFQNFKDDDYPASHARARRDEILAHPSDYLSDYNKIRTDAGVWPYFQRANMQVIKIFEGRVKAYHLAERLRDGLSIGTSSPEEHRERVINRIDIKHQDEIAAQKAAFSQRIEKLAEIHKHAEELIKKYPHLKAEIGRQLVVYQNEESSDEGQEPPPPEVY